MCVRRSGSTSLSQYVKLPMFALGWYGRPLALLCRCPYANAEVSRTQKQMPAVR
jgi:hypothetical protein